MDSFRREERHRLEADIRVIAEGEEAVALRMVDISPGGIGTDGLVQLERDMEVRVDFPDGTSRAGRMQWRDGFSAGILFDDPLDAEELEALMAALACKPYFARRRG